MHTNQTMLLNMYTSHSLTQDARIERCIYMSDNYIVQCHVCVCVCLLACVCVCVCIYVCVYLGGEEGGTHACVCVCIGLLTSVHSIT